MPVTESDTPYIWFKSFAFQTQKFSNGLIVDPNLVFFNLKIFALVFGWQVCLCECVRPWSYRQLLAVIWVLEIEQGPLVGQSMLLTAEIPLQSRF